METYRWSRVSQQTPVDLGKPPVLLHFARAALTTQTCLLVLVQKAADAILARTTR
jgi:hypothetical protein